MQRLIAFFIDNKLLGRMILLFVIMAGFFNMTTIQREGLPVISLNTITVTTVFPGAAPEDVELNVTIPIERELEAVTGIDFMTSSSTENLSVITIQLDEGLGDTQVARSLDEIKSAVDQVKNLPQEIDGRPVVKELRSSDFPVLEVALSGKVETVKYFARRLELDLRNLPGVSTVARVGLFDPEVHVELDPRRMDAAHISFDEVISSILTRNVRASGGSLNSYIGQKSIVTLAKFSDPLDVKNVILRSNFEEKAILLSQVANVVMREKDERLMVRSNGEEGVSLVISKKPSADVIRVVDSIKDYVEKQKFPAGVNYTFINDLSRRTRIRIGILQDNGMFGFVLVVIMLFIFLNLRTALWTAFGIPFSLLLVFILLPLTGEILHIMTLSGFLIVIGMLVDDAIVVAEHIESYKELGLPPREAAIRGTSEMSKPVAAAAFTTMAAFLPMFFLGGNSGKFVAGLPIVIVLALSASLFESYFLLPGHIAHAKGKKRSKAAWMTALENWYERQLKGALKRKYLVILGMILILVITMGITGRSIKVNMFPSEGSEQFYVKFITPIGSSLQRTAEDVKAVEKVILAMQKERKEIVSFSARVGILGSRGVGKTSGDQENWALISVYLSAASERQRGARDIIDELRRRSKVREGTRLLFEERRIGPPLGKPAEIIVMANDLDKREAAVAKIIAFLKSITGVTDVDRDDREGKKQVILLPRYRKLAAYGLTTRDIADVTRIAYDGRKVTSIQTPEAEIFYRVLIAPQYRRNIASLRLLKVRNRAGQLIPLSELVDFKTVTSRQYLMHYNGTRSVTVSAELDTKTITSVAVERRVRKELLAKWQLPSGVRLLIGGEARATQRIFGGVMIAFILAIAGIFFLVAMVLKSGILTIFVMAVIPFTLIGASITWLVHGLDLSFFAILGFLGLAGVVVNDSIVMVDRLNRETDKDHLDLDTIASLAKTRLRPILLTTVTTIVGLLPSGYGLSGSDPLVIPLALTLSYGLLFATVITLFLIPSLYLVRDDIRRKWHALVRMH